MEIIKKHKVRIALGAIFTIGILARILFLDRDNLWRDESFTANAASSSLPELINILISDSHPPFHLILLHFIIKLFGNSELVVRLPSVIFGIGVMVVTYNISKKFLVDNNKILLSVLLVALNPLLVVQSREARQYAILAFFFSLVLYFYLKIINGKHTRDYLFFMLFSLFICFTHYIGFFIFLAFSILLFINKKLDIKTHILMSLGFIPIIGLFLYQYMQIAGSDSWLTFNPLEDVYYNSMWVFIGIGFSHDPVLYFIQNIVIVLLLTSLILTILNYKRSNNIKNIFDFNVVVKLLIWIVSFASPLFYGRYISFLAIPIVLIIAEAQGFLVNKVRIIFVGLFILCLSFMTVSNSLKNMYPNYEGAIEFISDEAIIHISPESFHSFKYYSREGKILGTKSQFEYFQGLAAIKDSDFTKELPQSFYLVSDPNVSHNDNNYDFIKAQGYSPYEKRNFRGIIIELWKKTN